MSLMLRNSFLVSVLVLLLLPAALRAQDDLRDLLTRQLKYDAVIQKAEQQLKQGKTDRKEVLALGAYAYFLKGKLLLAAYDADVDLASLYYDCKQSGIARGENFALAQGLVSAAKGKTGDAINQLNAFRKNTKDKATSDIAGVWLGSLYDKEGKPTEREKAWKGLDWKNYGLSSERQTASVILKLKTPEVAARPSSMSDPRLVRNALLPATSLKEIPRNERLVLLENLHLDRPLYSAKGKAGKKEVYYDVFSLLAAARCDLSISRDLFVELDGSLTPDERSAKKYAALHNFIGQIAYLLDDYDGAIKALDGDKFGGSAVYLGAAYFSTGRKLEASRAWQTVEASGDLKSQSDLGYIYARLGVDLEKAEALTGKFLAGGEDAQAADQTLFRHYAYVKERQGDLVRARDLFGQGYNFMRRGVLEHGANDPEYTVAFCAILQRVDRTGMYDINEMLYKVREKYDFGVQLHEASTSLTTCVSIKLGK